MFVATKPCGVDGCGLRHYCKGLCQKHYYRQKRHGRTDLGYQERFQTCRADGCGKLRLANGLCQNHYAKLRNTGTLAPLVTRYSDPAARAKHRVAEWKKANWPGYKAYLAARKKRVKKATPRWADIGAIRDFYKNCPRGFHVDHIIPLNGKIVSGLHVLPNLQYLAAAENLRKGNRFDGSKAGN